MLNLGTRTELYGDGSNSIWNHRTIDQVRFRFRPGSVSICTEPPWRPYNWLRQILERGKGHKRILRKENSATDNVLKLKRNTEYAYADPTKKKKG